MTVCSWQPSTWQESAGSWPKFTLTTFTGGLLLISSGLNLALLNSWWPLDIDAKQIVSPILSRQIFDKSDPEELDQSVA